MSSDLSNVTCIYDFHKDNTVYLLQIIRNPHFKPKGRLSAGKALISSLVDDLDLGPLEVLAADFEVPMPLRLEAGRELVRLLIENDIYSLYLLSDNSSLPDETRFSASINALTILSREKEYPLLMSMALNNFSTFIRLKAGLKAVRILFEMGHDMILVGMSEDERLPKRVRRKAGNRAADTYYRLNDLESLTVLSYDQHVFPSVLSYARESLDRLKKKIEMASKEIDAREIMKRDFAAFQARNERHNPKRRRNLKLITT